MLLTRREFLRDSALIAGGIVLGGAAFLDKPVSAESKYPRGRIVFSLYEEKDRGDWVLASINGDGSGLQKLVDCPLGRDSSPAVSPDGNYIAYVSNCNSGKSNGADEIWLTDSRGFNPERFLRSSKGSVGVPVWSPDGRKLAYTTYDGESRGIFVLDLWGDGQKNLNNGLSSALRAVWSPDGKKVAFGHSEGVAVVNPDGSGLTFKSTSSDSHSPVFVSDGWLAWIEDQAIVVEGKPIVNNLGERVNGLAASPDGKRLAFSAARDVWTVSVDGASLKPLTIDGGVKTDQAPQWTPDDYILYESEENGWGVFARKADGIGNPIYYGPGLLSLSGQNLSSR